MLSGANYCGCIFYNRLRGVSETLISTANPHSTSLRRRRPPTESVLHTHLTGCPLRSNRSPPPAATRARPMQTLRPHPCRTIPARAAHLSARLGPSASVRRAARSSIRGIEEWLRRETLSENHESAARLPHSIVSVWVRSIEWSVLRARALEEQGPDGTQSRANSKLWSVHSEGSDRGVEGARGVAQGSP